MKIVFFASLVAALVYGIWLSNRLPSPLRTVVKALAVGLLAAVAAWHIPLMQDDLDRFRWTTLAVGLGLCAIGDAFLAGDPKRWLPLGLAAFLLGHIAFIVLFAAELPAEAPSVPILAAMAVVGIAAAAMLAWLWKHLGGLRWPVVAYVVVITAMAWTGLAHWPTSATWSIGALMFMVSDAILAAQLFRQARLFGSDRITGWAIWFLYFGAQLHFFAGLFFLGVAF